MSFEDNIEGENSFDITDLFAYKATRVYSNEFPSGRDYLYFYSLLRGGHYTDKPFAFWTYGMITPYLFKISPNAVEKEDISGVLRIVDLGRKSIATNLLLASIDLADRMDGQKDKITAMTPLTLNKGLIDICGIEFNIEYMPDYIVTPSGGSMRDIYSG